MSAQQESKALDKTATESKSKVADKKEKPKGPSKLTIFVPIILIILVSAIFVYLNNKITQLEAASSQNNLKYTDVTAQSEAQINDILSRFTGVQQKLEDLAAKQEVLSHSVSQSLGQQIHVNQDYALSEIEHLLIIANHNLQIDENVITALSAMEAADNRLKGLMDPAAATARQQLIADMNELRSINQADLSGTAFSLSDFISRVDGLVLKENVVLEQEEVVTEINEEPVEGVKHFFSLVFEELKSLVVITRDKDVGKARLLPDEVYFLRANLKLELANARFAVFNRDTENLRASIEHIQGWLDNYFDLEDADVSNIYESLSSMKKMEMKLPLLDISSSLESVRALARIQYENKDVADEDKVVE